MMAPLAEMTVEPLSPVGGAYLQHDDASIIMRVELEQQAKRRTSFSPKQTQQLLAKLSQQEEQPHRKQVTFSKTVSFREIPHLNNMTEDDIAYVWYSPEDYQLFRAVCKVTIRMIEKLGIAHTEQYDADLCCRGLEGKTQEGALRRKMTKLRVRDAVLLEQDTQFEQNIYHPQVLAETSQKLSLASLDEAFERGLSDARFAVLLTKYSDFV